MSFALPQLPFDPNGFNGFTSARTFALHHGAHHKKYVDTLNALLAEKPEYSGLSLAQIVHKSFENADTPVANNAGQHLNHDIFWQSLAEQGQAQPSGQLAEAIRGEFGSFDAFVGEFTKVATTVFGSGWAWLGKDASGRLFVQGYQNAGSPAANGGTPLLGLDVWEHAYYLDFENRRPEYIAAFFKHINWANVEGRFVEG